MIEPFRISICDARLAWIRERVAAYDWDLLPFTAGWRSGVGKADLRRLTEFWLERFDWRAIERRLNRLAHFTTEIAGQKLHFIHQRGDGSKPAILLLHGWPGSFLEFENLIEPLVADGHDVIVPSLPGFAFSTPLAAPIGPRAIAGLMHCLMVQCVGRSGYFVQGGDWGSSIGAWIATSHPQTCLGLHLNMVSATAEDATPSTPEERRYFARRLEIRDSEIGYSLVQGTRPQTLGAAMTDSPVGAAAWVLEKFGVWADLKRTADDSPDLWSCFSEERLLTNLMLYLGPNAFVTATWLYQGSRAENALALPKGAFITTPTGVAAFPDPVFPPPPRSWVEKSYNVVHWTDMPKGGHFAALEQPDALLADLRVFIAACVCPGSGDRAGAIG